MRAARACLARLPATLLAGTIAIAVPGAGATPVPAQGGEAEVAPDLEALRARWWGKSEQERLLLRERFELLRRFPAHRRHELLERARAWRRVAGELRRAAPDAVRREIDGLGPEASRARWRERARQSGRHRLDRLPEELRRHLEGMAPAERRPFLERFRRERDLRSRRALVVMGRRAGLAPERIRALMELPPERLREAVLELRRRLHGADERPFAEQPRRHAPGGPRPWPLPRAGEQDASSPCPRPAPPSPRS
ncbi:MAG: hypothetical protein ABFS41_18680 [Myxococcota bacterium]